MEDLTGKQLGPYRVVAPLGEGGMAAVYKAYQPSMERYVALKILPDHFVTKFEFMTRFEQEAKVLAQLQHPHILPVFDYGDDDGHPYIAMPFLQSGDLTDMMEGQPLPLAQIRRIISQIGDALDYAHQHGLVHRDVKPSNVLLDERGNCLLTDFGIAKIVEGDAPADITTTGTFVGTPAYMSPEQGMGKKLDGRSDIYAMGIVLYELATGRVPFRAETPMAVVVKHMNDPLPLPHKLNPALPEAVEQVILKALSKQPEGRYATAGDMVQALLVAIPDTTATLPAAVGEQATLLSAAEPTVAAQSQETVKPAVGKKPLPVWVWAVVAGVVLIATVAAIAFFTSGDTQEETKAGNAPIVADVSTPAEVLPDAGDEAAPPAATETTIVETTNPSLDNIYDDFDDLVYQGDFDHARWRAEYNGGTLTQQDGVLVAARDGGEEGQTVLLSRAYEGIQLADPTFFEAKFKLDPDHHAGAVLMALGAQLSENVYWNSDCSFDSLEGRSEVWAKCVDNTWPEQKGHRYDSDSITYRTDTWHVVRIEVEPDTMTFTYYLDGQMVGSHVPVDAGQLKQAEFSFRVGVWSPSSDAMTGYIDDVRIGEVESPVVSRPVPAPKITAGAAADTTLYDAFDAPAFDGSFNPEKWGDFGTGQIVQENGSLTIVREGEPENATGLVALDYRREPIRHPTFFEASFMAEEPQDGHAYIFLYSHLPTEDYTDCTLNLENNQAMIHCSYFHNGNSAFWTEDLPVDYSTWHSLRIVVEPATMTFTYFLDGQEIDAYAPPNPDELEAASFQFDIGVWGASTEPVTAYIDKVRVGQIHQTVYDDFDDLAFDGDWNAELWAPTYNFEGTEAIQQDGVLQLARFTAEASGLRALQFDDVPIEDIATVEAKIKLDRDVEASYGDVGIVLGAGGGEWWFGCYIGATQGNTEGSVECGGSEDDDSESKTVQLNTWHTVRFEINPEPMGITFFIDGDRIDEFIPADPDALRQAKFMVDLKVYSEDGGHIIGYFDDVKIGPVEP